MRLFLLFVFFFFPDYVFSNVLLDVGVLSKKDGKAIVFIFKEPVKRNEWKIKFSENRISVELYGFSSKINDISFLKIPGVEDFSLSQKEDAVKISFLLKEPIRDLISKKELTFLTKDPNMLGIMLTNGYLERFKEKAEEKKEEIPFIKYEELLGDIKKKNPQVQKKPLKKEQKEEKDILKEFSIVRLISGLSIVLGIILVTLFLWKKFISMRYQKRQGIIRILDLHYLGSRQAVAVLQIGEERFLIGITPQNISFLTKVSFEDVKHLESKEDIEEKAVDLLRKSLSQLRKV